jgi:hypothetical protein
MSTTPFVKFKQDLGDDKFALNTAGYGITEAGIWLPIKVTDEGVQEVQLKGGLRQTIVTGAKTVTNTAAEIFAGSNRLDGRHAMVITNMGADIVYIGDSDVTTSNGFPLFPQDTLRIEFDPTSSVGVFACTSGTNVQVRVVELA